MASVITATAHGLSVDDPFYFANVLPTDAGVDGSTVYYVLTTPTADTFTFSDSVGGTAITLDYDIDSCDIVDVDTYEEEVVPGAPTAQSAPSVSSDVVDNIVRLLVTITDPGDSPVRVREVAATREFSAGFPVWTNAIVQVVNPTVTQLMYPALPGTKYAVRVRVQDVYGQYTAWSTATEHTVTTSGADSRGVRNLDTGATVTIDENGITIEDGSLFLKDEFGKSTISAGAITGSLEDQTLTGFPNGSFGSNTAGTPAMGRTAAVPYWTLANVVGSNEAWTSGVGYVQCDLKTAANQIRMTSDFIRVRSGLQHRIYIQDGLTDLTATGATRVVKVNQYDVSHNLVSSSTVDSNAFTGGGGGVFTTRCDALRFTEASTGGPAATVFIKVVIEVTVTTAVSSHCTYVVNEVGIYVHDDDWAGQDINPANIDTGSVLNGGSDQAKSGSLYGVISPTALAADTNNWNPTNVQNISHIRVSTDSTVRTLTGIVAPSGWGFPQGRMLWLHNINNSTRLILAHDATSTAANRFYCPDGVDYTLKAKQSVLLTYDETDSRWRVGGSKSLTFNRGVVVVPFSWSGTLPGASTTDLSINDAAMGPAQIRGPFASKVVGISWALSASRTAGTATAQAFNGSTSALVGPTAVIDGTTTNNATGTATAIGTADFSASNLIRLRITTASSFSTGGAHTIVGHLYLALSDETG